jgi:flagellar protein FliL
MAEEEQKNTGDATTVKPKKSNLKWILLLIILQIILTGGGFWYLGSLKNNSSETELAPEIAVEEPAIVEEPVEEPPLKEEEGIIGAIYPLDVMVVNLNPSGYIRVELQILFKTRDVSPKFLNKLPFIRDNLISLISQKTKENLLSKDGKINLKSDTKAVIDRILGETIVEDILYAQFVIQ